jgi:hypothetical protein
MIEEKNVLPVKPPSMAKILAATVVMFVVAAVILFVAVLPAEYGIDPLGTGKALGLMDLAKTSAEPVIPVAMAEATIAPVLEPSSDGGAPTVKGTFIAQSKGYKVDSREYTLDPHEGMEIKYNMKKGAGLIYSWVTNRTVLYEFHGDPNVKPPEMGRDYFESYEADYSVGKDQSHGTFIAPSSGIHGWFWENRSDEPVTLKLVTAGFYDFIQESRRDKQIAIDPMDPK